MRVITVTTYNVYNYGAALQAYALQRYIANQGHDTELLNYQPEYLRRRYDYKWVNPESSMSKYAITRFVYRIAKYLQRQTTMKRKRSFDSFIAEYLNQTRLYKSRNEVKAQPPSADAFIVGSDQVWNTFYDAGRDGIFYLDFVNEGIRASYAASFSFLDIDEEIKPSIKKWLSVFNAISVREYQGVTILNNLGLKGEWVMDPVFLLDTKTWVDLFKPVPPSEKYLLVYDFEGNKDIKRFAKLYAKENGLKIYSINDTYPQLYADENFNREGPKEFLALLYNSAVFVSNSFHGTAFSIIFQKPFLVFGRHRHAVNSRMESLLKMFGLENRYISSYVPSSDIMNESINWDKIEEIKNNFINTSKQYLGSILQDAQIGKNRKTLVS